MTDAVSGIGKISETCYSFVVSVGYNGPHLRNCQVERPADDVGDASMELIGKIVFAFCAIIVIAIIAKSAKG